MAEDRNARPVSGEIMTGSDLPLRDRGAVLDVVDAEFETVERNRDERGERPAQIRELIGTAAPPLQGMDVLKAGEPTAPARRQKGGPAFWIFGLAIAAGAFWISGGHALVSDKPTSTPVATDTPGRGIRIGEVSSRIEDAGGRIVLFVDGEAINDGVSPAQLPPLEITVTAGDGQATRYKLGTAERELAPAARFSFSSRLEAPKSGVKSVSVDFMDENK